MSRRFAKQTTRSSVILMLAAVTLLGATACGGSNPDKPSSKQSSRADIESGGESKKAILPEDQLPEKWRYATDEDFLGIPKVCGVILEPPSLSSAITQRFTQSFAGPFVIQYSFVSSDEAATKKRIDTFVSEAATCSSYEPTKDSKVLVTQIDDIPAVGDAFAAVGAVNAADTSDMRDYVVFRTGKQVTVLLSYSRTDLASHADLAAMAESIAATVEASQS